MNTARDNFYFVEDLMKMLDLSRSKCYKIIHQLNDELMDAGYFTIPGRVSKYYYHKRLYCGPNPTENPLPANGRKRAINDQPVGARR